MSQAHKQIKVLLLSKYARNGASSRLRFLQFLPALEAHGIAVSAHPLFDSHYLTQRYKGARGLGWRVTRAYFRRFFKLFHARKYDLLWIQGELFPYLPASFERLLGALNIPYVVDYDDALYHRYDQSSSRLIKATLSRKIHPVMRSARLVTVGNAYLANYAKAAGAREIINIPTVLDHTRYHPRPKAPQSPMVIGWIGTPPTSKYLAKIAPAIEANCQKFSAEFRAIGAPPSIAEAFKHIKPKHITWHEAREAADVAQFDVGLMPLASSPWEQGKCGYKIIQYMASGVPVVATETAANRAIIERGTAGTILPPEASTAQWAAAIEAILSQPEKARTMGHSGRKAVIEAYSIEAVTPLLAKALHAAAHKAPR